MNVWIIYIAVLAVLSITVNMILACGWIIERSEKRNLKSIQKTQTKKNQIKRNIGWISRKVFDCIEQRKRPVSVEKIAMETKLTKQQVKDSLRRLSSKGLICTTKAKYTHNQKYKSIAAYEQPEKNPNKLDRKIHIRPGLIKEALAIDGSTISEVAAVVGVDVKTLESALSSMSRLRESTVEKIEDVLDIPTGTLRR